MEAIGGLLLGAAMLAMLLSFISVLWPLESLGLPTRKRSAQALLVSIFMVGVAGSLMDDPEGERRQAEREAAREERERAAATGAPQEPAAPLEQESPTARRIDGDHQIDCQDRDYTYRLSRNAGEHTLDEIRQMAEHGHPVAQYNLGVRYDFGEGVPEDNAEAVRWYRLAAQQCHAVAQFYLGISYDFGEGVPEDDAEAVRWYRLAAEQGYAAAQYNLGSMYGNGAGVPEDAVLSHMWSSIADANGNETARELRDRLESGMTRAEISRAMELARACMDSDYRDCERE